MIDELSALEYTLDWLTRAEEKMANPFSRAVADLLIQTCKDEINALFPQDEPEWTT